MFQLKKPPVFVWPQESEKAFSICMATATSSRHQPANQNLSLAQNAFGICMATHRQKTHSNCSILIFDFECLTHLYGYNPNFSDSHDY